MGGVVVCQEEKEFPWELGGGGLMEMKAEEGLGGILGSRGVQSMGLGGGRNRWVKVEQEHKGRE